MSWILLSIPLGFVGFGIARDDARAAFELARLPGEKVWERSLSAAGLREIKETALIQKAARLLPSMLDASGSVWINDSPLWVSVGGPQGFRFFAEPPSPGNRKRPEAPPLWQPIGRGWEGLENALARIETRKAGHSPRAEGPKSSEPLDPREIRY